MRIRIIRVTKGFEKSYRKLPKSVQHAAERRELVFRENPFDPQLKTHRLHGREKEA